MLLTAGATNEATKGNGSRVVHEPLSPFHQFSNSSLAHDFYERYLSQDGHQPLQTPLIGIERTQDLLSLKLPPHGPEPDTDSQRFIKNWPFGDTTKYSDNEHHATRAKNNISADKDRDQDSSSNVHHMSSKIQEDPSSKELESQNRPTNSQKSFSFNYKSESSVKAADRTDQHEPIDLNVNYDQDGCCSQSVKSNIFDESMKHFNPDRVKRNSCFNLRAKTESPEHPSEQSPETDNAINLAHQYHAQESMFGIDFSKHKFQYILAAPISGATKLTEDTMTYLNQGQAYEIKLENMTDVPEAKKGFMCSIINIGFHERHMQQAENELWQQWSQQHPNEKIFSVDMKLSYNVFGVESDGLNKYEFLWDSSKAAGVFIRINSISTEFTPKKHGGEKGVPFKLSIETFSYNSKTHDSYFISAACCQIKVFKPKGAERKIRSDRDKVSKRLLDEQEKYHKSNDRTEFKECSITSLHPMADGSLCFYRHSHGHFASKQVVSSSVSGTPAVQNHQSQSHRNDDEVNHNNNIPQQNHSPANQLPESRPSQTNSETSNNGQSAFVNANNDNHQHSNHEPSNHHFTNNGNNSAANNNHTNELPQVGPFSAQMYHNNHQVRSVAGLASLNNIQHFGMAYYGHHALPNHTIPPHISPSAGYGAPTSCAASYGNHNPFSLPSSTSKKPIYRQLASHDKSPATSAFHNTAIGRAPNLPPTVSNNFQIHLNNGNQNEQCSDTPPVQCHKDSIGGNGQYQHYGYDSHLHHHSIHSSSQTNHHQPLFKQRGTTSTLLNSAASVHNHSPTHNNGANQSATTSRHYDSYMSSNGLASSNNQTSGNHWNSVAMNTSQEHLASPNSICTQRSNSNVNAPTHEHQIYNNSNNNHYECHDEPCDSDNSPNKNTHHTSESSSSCYSRIKNDPSMITCNQMDHYESPGGGSLNSSHSSHLTINSNCPDVISWLLTNRFGHYARTFNNFSGSDLLRLSKTELIEICGLIDGIRLFNTLHNRPIKPRKVIYVCQKAGDTFHPIYLYDVALKELLRELSIIVRSFVTANEEQETSSDKPNLTAGSGTDSRSSLGAVSTDTGTDEGFMNSEHFFNEMEPQRRPRFSLTSSRSPNGSNSDISQNVIIDRLLIDGITSVKIVATEQFVQMIEDESAWIIESVSEKAGLVEACISACRSKRPSN